MVHESLAAQLRRIGVLPGIAVALAAALATFALLDQLMPIASGGTAPRVVTPVSAQAPRLQPIAAPDSGAGGGAGLTAAERGQAKLLSAQRREAIKQAQAQIRIQNRIISAQGRRTATLPRLIRVGKSPAPAHRQTTIPSSHTFKQKTTSTGKVHK
jgi:hypothetical protein